MKGFRSGSKVDHLVYVLLFFFIYDRSQRDAFDFGRPRLVVLTFGEDKLSWSEGQTFEIALHLISNIRLQYMHDCIKQRNESSDSLKFIHRCWKSS